MPLRNLVIRFLSRSNTSRKVSLGAGLYSFVSFVGYSVVNWVSSILIRSDGMGMQEVGTWLPLIIGVGSAAASEPSAEAGSRIVEPSRIRAGACCCRPGP